MNTKLRMLLPLILLLCMYEAWAQSQSNSGEMNSENTFVVGNGSNKDNRIPIYGITTSYIAGGHSQFIYPSTLLQSMGKNDITGMTFYCSESSSYQNTDFGNAEFKVFLKEVDYTAFSSEEFIDWDSMTQVYAGRLSGSGSQMKITFDTPYTYQGKNLMVGFYVTSLGSESGTPFWLGTENSINNCIVDNGGFIISRKFIPNTTFSYIVPDLSLADDADNQNVIASHAGKKVNATLQGRTLYKDDSWNTLCLPFAVNSFTGTPLEGATVKTLSDSDFDGASGTLTLNFSDNLNAIEAGVPYIVKWPGGDAISNPSFEGVVIDNTLNGIETNAVTFEGHYSPYIIGTEKSTTYAVAELDGTTLTFKVTTEEPDGVTSWDVEDTGSSMLGWDSSRSSIRKVVFDPSFATACPKSCYAWFHDCANLSEIEGIEYLNTSETTSMGWMFAACYSLTSVDLSHFDTRKVKNMKMMFYCFPGQTLDLSSFDTSNVEDMNAMFHVCIYLKTIYVSSRWSTANVGATSVFRRCESLVGGANTAFDESHDGVDYAQIDGGPDNPGYFTGKEAPDYEESTTEEQEEEGDNTLLYMGADNKLYYPNTSMTINAFRSIFRLKDGRIAGEPSSAQGINRFVLNFDGDEATSIKEVDHGQSTSGNHVDTWFTIDGQELYGKPMRKGIYILNGKKYIVK